MNKLDFLIQRAKDKKLPHGLLFVNPLDGVTQDFLSQLPGINPHDIFHAEHKIDSIREGIRFLTIKSDQSPRILVIEQCENLSIAASNSLLKTLEAPGSNHFIILTTHSDKLILPTIRSRCEVIYFNQHPVERDTEFRLALENPNNSAFYIAEKFEKHNGLAIVNELFYLLSDKLIRKNDKNLFIYWDKLIRLKRQLSIGASLNQKLWLEDILLKKEYFYER